MIALITASYARDFEACRLLAQSIDAYVTGFSRHYVVVASEDVALFSQLAGPGREIIDAARLLPKMFELPLRRRGRRYFWRFGMRAPVFGWHLQQLRKIAMTLAQPEARVLHIDSDNCFCRPFDLGALAAGRVKLQREAGGAHAGRPEHVVWWQNAHRALGLPAPALPGDDYVGQMIVWEKASTEAMVARIGAASGRPWWLTLARQRDFSEYMLYGVAVSSDAELMARHEVVTESPCLAYWDGPALDAATLAEFARGLKPQQAAIAVQSFTGTPIEVLRDFALGQERCCMSVSAVVVVPTFRRPQMLEKTLASLAAQRGGVSFAVLVVENDAGLAGRQVAEARGIAVVVEPRQGNVAAINCGFAAALSRWPEARYFLMIDDDEIATPDWLERMVGAAERSGAGIVGGPVTPEFEAEVDEGMRSHPVFWPIAAPTGPVPMIYGSGNCLIRREVFALLGLPAFDIAFNFLGGGDTDFFTRAKRAGVAFYWQADALITEIVPEARTERGWVFRRGLRIGAINRRLDLKSGPAPLVLAKDLAILVLAPWRFARELWRTRSLLRASHPVNIALGRLLAIGGLETRQYRAAR